jgi:hypothetical protein
MANPEDPGQQPVAPITTMVEHVAIPSTAGGLTKREWFIGMAMSGFCANPAEDYIHASFADIASWAEQQADAQLDRLANGGAA